MKRLPNPLSHVHNEGWYNLKGNQMKTIIKSVAFASALALVAAACADDDETETEETETTEAAEAEGSETEEAMDDSEEAMDDDAMDDEHSEDAAYATVVDIAASDENFSTLVAAVEAAGLVETLSDADAEFTVFAPTNEAFEAALAELGLTAEELLASEDLEGILLNHVLSGKVDSEAAVAADGTAVETVGGGSLDVALDGEALTVGGATVTTADLKAENGVVHVIDAVLLP